MMSHGYEVQMTPLQILTFYNAVANDGKNDASTLCFRSCISWVSYHRVEPEVITSSICSRSTINKAKKMLEGLLSMEPRQI